MTIETADASSHDAPDHPPFSEAETAPHGAHPREPLSAFLARACAFDQERPSFTGEHALTFSAGLGLLLLATGRGPLLRGVAAATGAALIVRSLSGRDGIASLRR